MQTGELIFMREQIMNIGQDELAGMLQVELEVVENWESHASCIPDDIAKAISQAACGEDDCTSGIAGYVNCRISEFLDILELETAAKIAIGDLCMVWDFEIQDVDAVMFKDSLAVENGYAVLYATYDCSKNHVYDWLSDVEGSNLDEVELDGISETPQAVVDMLGAYEIHQIRKLDFTNHVEVITDELDTLRLMQVTYQ